MYYFYIWKRRVVLDTSDTIVTRTCFGISNNIRKRIDYYFSHVGEQVRLTAAWSGPARVARELELHLKTQFSAYLVRGRRENKIEWVSEEVTTDQIIKWVEWEVSNGAYTSMIKQDVSDLYS
jgi:hypothetical protein